MEGAKTKIILTALVVIVIVAASIGFYFIKDAGVEGITALEGKVVAEEVAGNWCVNATLVGVRKSGNMNYQHEFSSWFYVYLDTTNNSRPHQCIEIKVNTTGYIISTYEDWSSPNIPIEYWNIDSNDAYEIATNNGEINSFLKHNPTVDSFSLSCGSGQSIWYIKWAYDAGFDNPKWAQIQIDANTGEVLYVEADN